MIVRILYGLLLFLSVSTYGQTLNCDFMGEGNSNKVKLKWVPYTWPQSLEGFLVKRRTVNNGKPSEWLPLHSDLIYPALSSSKDYANVEKLSSEQQRLKEKIRKMIVEGNASEIAQKDFYGRILGNEAMLKGLRVGFVVDYDLALLQGFGLIDRDIPTADSYEYGLFPKYAGKPVEGSPVKTFQWKYGTQPDLTLKVESKIKRFGRKNEIEVIWSVNTDEMRNKKIAGFNIYRKIGNEEYEKLNNNVVFISVSNKTEQLVHHDEIKNDSIPIHYAAVPVSAFGTEGSRYEIPYSRANTQVYIGSPKLHKNTSTSPGELTFTWEFDKESEVDVNGFQVERKSTSKPNDKFVAVSNSIPASSRSFTDKSIPGKGYYDYRLITVKKSNEKIEGETISTYYGFAQSPPIPQNLKGTFVKGTDTDYIQLTWDKRSSADTLTKQYHIYLGTPSEDQLYDDSTIPKISDNTYRFNVGLYQRGQWRFAIAAITSSGVESEKTETVLVFAPSKVVPPVSNNYMVAENNRAKITWEYFGESVPDLAGFRIFKNGVLVADEKVLKVGVVQWTSETLELGKRYLFEIMAVTSYNVASEKSEGVVIVK